MYCFREVAFHDSSVLWKTTKEGGGRLCICLRGKITHETESIKRRLQLTAHREEKVACGVICREVTLDQQLLHPDIQRGAELTQRGEQPQHLIAHPDIDGEHRLVMGMRWCLPALRRVYMQQLLQQLPVLRPRVAQYLTTQTAQQISRHLV